MPQAVDCLGLKPIGRRVFWGHKSSPYSILGRTVGYLINILMRPVGFGVVSSFNYRTSKQFYSE